MSGTPWLSELTTGQLDVLFGHLDLAQASITEVYGPDQHDLWHEVMDLLDDGHASWNEAFLRDKVQRLELR